MVIWRGRRSQPLAAGVAAAERTTLAWERTALSLAGVGALLAHSGRRHVAAHVGFGVALLVGALMVVLVVAPLRHRAATRAAQGGPSPASAWTPRLIAVSLASVSLALAVEELMGGGNLG